MLNILQRQCFTEYCYCSAIYEQSLAEAGLHDDALHVGGVQHRDEERVVARQQLLAAEGGNLHLDIDTFGKQKVESKEWTSKLVISTWCSLCWAGWAVARAAIMTNTATTTARVMVESTAGLILWILFIRCLRP